MAGKAGRSGRKPKDQEQRLVEMLSPYDEEAVQILIKAMREGKPWAMKMFAEYRWAKPKANDTQINARVELPSWIQNL